MVAALPAGYWTTTAFQQAAGQIRPAAAAPCAAVAVASTLTTMVLLRMQLPLEPIPAAAAVAAKSFDDHCCHAMCSRLMQQRSAAPSPAQPLP
jgi:hypothetical protein